MPVSSGDDDFGALAVYSRSGGAFDREDGDFLQAVANVLRNALLYTEAGGRVLLRAEGGRDAARIIVSDNGRGIAPADQARVFDRFQRTANSLRRLCETIGLERRPRHVEDIVAYARRVHAERAAASATDVEGDSDD